jgi:drug/metabolite transporter (DMT)-like permease
VRGALLALAAALLFGASTPASKWLLGDVAPLALAGLLYLGAALGTARAALGARAQPDRASLGRLGAAIVAGGVAGPVLLLQGLSVALAGSVSLLLNLELAATALLGALFFRDALDTRGWLGVAGVVAAGAIVSADAGWPGVEAALWVAAACTCWALDNHWTARIDGLAPAQSTFAKGLAAGATNLALAAFAGDLDFAARSAALALGVGALGYGVSVALYIAAAQQLGATRAQAVFATAPFAGAALSWGVLGEPVRGAQIAGGLLLAASIALLLRARHEHEHVHEALEHLHEHRHDDGHHDHGHDVPVVAGVRHAHRHRHEPRIHAHPHWPDLHHRHGHRSRAPHGHD